MTSEPWDPLPSGLVDAHARRRHELFTLAAPVFREHGYRGATVAALAYACHLSPAALYHYFPSKAALATALLDEPRLDWSIVAVDPRRPPLDQLHEFIAVAAAAVPDYLLAIELAREVGRPTDRRALRGIFADGAAAFGRVIQAAAPTLDRGRAEEVARRIVAVLVAPDGVFPMSTADDTRRRIVDLLRAHLVPPIDAVVFDEAMPIRTDRGFDSVGRR